MAVQRYQPQGLARLRLTSSLVRGLASVILPTMGTPGTDLVTRQQLTIGGAPTISAGRGGIGLVTNGSSSYAWRTAPEISGQTGYTLTMVCQANGTGTDTRALGLGYSGSNNDIVAIGAGQSNAQKVRIFARNDAGGSPGGSDSVSTPFDGGLHTIVMTFDTTTTTANINLYVDGVLDTAYSSSQTAGSLLVDRIALGCLVRGSASAFWKGTIYLAAVHTRVLSQAEGLSLSANPWQLFDPVEEDDIVAAGGSGVTGTLDWTEADDTYSIAGTVTDVATLSWIEANDAFSMTGVLNDRASISYTESDDTFSASGVVTDTATISWTETDDIFAMQGFETDLVSLVWTESNDVFSAAGSVYNSAAIGWIEPDDQVTITSLATDFATIAWTEPDDGALFLNSTNTSGQGKRRRSRHA